MNTQHDELETLLGAGLRDRAADVDGTWVDFPGVRGRATSIRRRRRVAAGVGVAAAVALFAPLAVSVTGVLQSDREDQPAPPAPTELVVRTTLTLEDLERGDDPAIEYFTADGVVLPDGGLHELDSSLQALVPSEVDGGWLAVGPAADEVLELSEDFSETGAMAMSGGLVTNPDRSLAAWSTPTSDGQTLLLHSTTDPDMDREWDFPPTPQVEAVGFAGVGNLLFRTIGQDGSHGIGLASEDGTTTMLEGDYVKAISADPTTGRIAVQTKSRADLSSCSAVLDPTGTTTEWETCDFLLGAFSPDGRHVLASDPVQSGLGMGSLSVLDAATGRLVASFEQPRRGRLMLVGGVAWESDSTIVAGALEGTTTTLLRLGVDGTLEETVEPVENDPNSDLAFYLGQDRRRGF